MSQRGCGFLAGWSGFSKIAKSWFPRAMMVGAMGCANVRQSSIRPLLAKDARNGAPTGFLAGASAGGLETWATRLAIRDVQTFQKAQGLPAGADAVTSSASRDAGGIMSHPCKKTQGWGTLSGNGAYKDR